MTIRQRATSNISAVFRILLREKTAAHSTTLVSPVSVTEATAVYQTTAISKLGQVELTGLTQLCLLGSCRCRHSQTEVKFHTEKILLRFSRPDVCTDDILPRQRTKESDFHIL